MNLNALLADKDIVDQKKKKRLVLPGRDGSLVLPTACPLRDVPSLYLLPALTKLPKTPPLGIDRPSPASKQPIFPSEDCPVDANTHMRLPLPPVTAQSYHQRSDSRYIQGRRRNSSFSGRYTDIMPRSMVLSRVGLPLVQTQRAPTKDYTNVWNAPIPAILSFPKSKGDSIGFVGSHLKRRQEDEVHDPFVGE